MMRRRKAACIVAGMSLKSKLAVGAALLCLIAVMVTAVSVMATQRMSQHLQAALSAETRVARYGDLSAQVASFLVIGTEAVQTGLDAPARTQRIDSLSQSIDATFARLRADLGVAVEEARALGIDAASRRATQSLGIARMEAQFENTRRSYVAEDASAEQLRGALDSFAVRFDPLLNGVVTEEIRARADLVSGIEKLRQRMSVAAVALSLLAVFAVLVFYFGLVRPNLGRLDTLVTAARRIGDEDFAVALPDRPRDEIGRLMSETNRMAAALAARRGEVNAEWTRLNEIVAARTADLTAANDKLARTDEDRRRFFADVSHELRTPLTVIAMEAEIGRAAGGPAAPSFATIEARAARLNRRIDDLLRIARSDSGRLELADIDLDLADVAREALAESDAVLLSAGLSVSCDLSDALAARGDPNWLRQVIANLIGNAARHARDGGRLAVSGQAEGGQVVLSVIDNGAGIADPEAASGRFAQAGGAARAEGFGIGLALAKWVIESHGGSLTITSPVARHEALGERPGTKVALSLPAARD